MKIIDVSTEAKARELVTALSAQQRAWLAAALRDHDQTELAREIIATVREWWQARAEPGEPSAYAIVFQATDWENGWFVWSGSQVVHYADGTQRATYEQIEGLEDLFTDLYGTVHDRFQVAVDLRDWSLHDEENADVMGLIPAPERATTA